MVGGMVALWFPRRQLVMTDFGTSYPLMAIGVVLIVVAILVAVKRKKYLTWRILVGVPEVASEGPGELLTQGPYSVVRNPRYLEVLIGTAGYAFVANFLGGYVLTALCFPAIHFLVLIEERELRDRFGARYDEYCGRVPRFIPKRRSPSGA